MTNPHSLEPLDVACYDMTLMLDGLSNAALCRMAAKVEHEKRRPFSANVTIAGNPAPFLERAEGFDLFADIHRQWAVGSE